MEGGDISNEVSPRLLIVWENLLGLLPTKADQAKVSTYLRLRRYKRAADVFEINDLLGRRIWDIVWRLKYSVDVVTWISPEFRDALEVRLDREDLPVGHVLYENPSAFARKISTMPYVAALYTPDPDHAFTFGRKGRVVSPVDAPRLVGSF